MRQLFLKLNNKHFLVLGGNAALSLFGVATYSLIWHFLSPKDTGIYFLFLTIIGILDAIRNGFLESGAVKFYAGTEREKGIPILGSVWFLAIALTAAVLLINAGGILLLPYIHDEIATICIKWFGITFLSSLTFSVIYWKLQADEQYGKLLWLKMVNSVTTPLSFVILFFFRKMTLENTIIYNFITNFLTSFVGIVWGLSGIKTILKRSKASILELMHFGKYTLGTSLVSVMLGSTDAFIITFILGPAALAVYAIPKKLMEINELFLRSFLVTGRSGMAIAFNKDNLHQVTYIMKKYAGMLTIAFIPLCITGLLLANVATGLLAGGKYANSEAANIYRLLMIFALLSPIDRFNGMTLDMIHKPKINFHKVIVMLVVNILADFAGLAIYKDLYSIAFAGFIMTFTGVIFGYINLSKYIDYSIPGILSTGFNEMNLFLKKHLKIGQ